MTKLKFKHYSYLTILIAALTCLQFRAFYSDITNKRELKVTTWDALGYYIYLPAIFIYQDYHKYEWFPEIDEKYEVSGGWVYQLSDLENGNKVGKYLGGVAILQAPFFGIGHAIALSTDYPADGFSAPYQYALGFGVIFWFVLGLLILRKVLKVFFSETVTAWTLAMLVLATNSIQYVSVDNAMSHAYIFTLYAMLLFTTIQWHAKPKKEWAFFMGLIIGLACISRPTELIMILIPILWFTQTKTNGKKKWDLVRANKKQILFLALGGILGVAPQIIYWKQVTGSFIYDVGSKWDFANPWWRVLFGPEKGFFIYTPITILFIVGMFIAKKRGYPFRKSVIWFGLINIYIIISWHHWQYGASYSTRALMQSYPLYALPLAVCIQEIVLLKKWKWVATVVAMYLIALNIFQTWQYNETILHNRDNTWKYYRAIYWDANPTPLDMSLLDTDEVFRGRPDKIVMSQGFGEPRTVSISGGDSLYFAIEGPAAQIEGINETKVVRWYKVQAKIKASKGLWNANLKALVTAGEKEMIRKERNFRMWNAMCDQGISNTYEFYIKAPENEGEPNLSLGIFPESDFEAVIEDYRIELLFVND